MIKAIIFDCFGVLTEDGWLAFCNKYLTKENQEEVRYINHQADKGLVTYEEFLSTVCRLTGAPWDEAHTTITTTHHPNEVLFEHIKKLKRSGYTLGVISNVGDELHNFLPQSYVDLFDEVTLSYHVHAIKPDPEIYEYHLQKLGLKAEETVFFDDRQYNAQGAISVGMNAFTYTSVEQVIKDLESLGIPIKDM